MHAEAFVPAWHPPCVCNPARAFVKGDQVTTMGTFVTQAYQHPRVRPSLMLLLRLGMIVLLVYLFIPE